MLNIIELNQNINIRPKEKAKLGKGKLKYLFLVREPSQEGNITFSISLLNKDTHNIRDLWFSFFMGIGASKYAPGLDNQEMFNIIPFSGQHFSTYLKDGMAFPPETLIEVAYVDFPISNLKKAGSIEFFYGSERSKKVEFKAKWEDDELKADNASDFLEFIKKKNKQRSGLFSRIRKAIKGKTN